MLAEAEPTPSSRPSPAPSEAASSSLSELEELPEEPKAPDADASEDEDIKDNDTEAETERLHPTPQKRSRLVPDGNIHRVVLGSGAAMRRPTSQDALNVLDTLSADIPAGELISDIGLNSPTIRSPKELAGTKRKWSSSLSDLEDSFLPSLERNPRGNDSRKSSGQESTEPSPDEHLGFRVNARDDTEMQRDQAIAEYEVEDDEQPSDRPKDRLEDVVISQDVPKEPIEEDMEIPDSSEVAVEYNGPAVTENIEDEDHAAAENEDEEAEVAAKSNDELARRQVAVEALMPIERCFAIFRDKLYDERLGSVSAELELLNQPDTTHQLFLAMRGAIDARRDEKIQLEQTALLYKVKSLETTTLAERSIRHSHYFQQVRDSRERHMDHLNETLTTVQRERRQWKARDPHFSLLFNPKRSAQVKQQQAYNKEVSLLAGIARHAGFPAAPELSGASSAEVEDDLRRMRVNPPRASVVAQIASSSHVDEMAGEDGFLARNPWARSLPAVQRTATRGDSTTPQPKGQASSTPVNRLRKPKSDQKVVSSGPGICVASSLPPSVRAPNALHAQSREELFADSETRVSSTYGAEPPKHDKTLHESEHAPPPRPRSSFNHSTTYNQENSASYRHDHNEAVNPAKGEQTDLGHKGKVQSSPFFWRQSQERHQFPNGGLTQGRKVQGLGLK